MTHSLTVNSEVGKRSIKHKGSKLWNVLPVNLKNIYEKVLFEKQLKERLICRWSKVYCLPILALFFHCVLSFFANVS